jgi:transposase
MKNIPKKNKLMFALEEQHGIIVEEILRQKFVVEGKTLYAISSELGINYTTLLRWLNWAGLYHRKIDL